MKYQIGDEILVLHSNEEGRVIDIMNEQMVMIEVRGVKFPAYLDQIDFPYFKRFTEKKLVPEKKNPSSVQLAQTPKEKSVPIKMNLEEGVWLRLIPKFTLDDFNDEVVDHFKIYLINQTNTSYQFVYKQMLLGNVNFELTNQIAENHEMYLHDFGFEMVNDAPSFDFDFSLVQPNPLKAAHYESTIKLKPKQVIKKVAAFLENPQTDFSFSLFQNYPNQTSHSYFELGSLAAKGYKVYESGKAKNYLPAFQSVVDLHIDKLTHTWAQLNKNEILGIQLSEFEKILDNAIAHHQKSLIVIHGMGEGILRDEIHGILKSHREVKRFVNQYDPRFGYGATEIFFQ